MKLADYEIREALSRKDWPAAVAALARHYGVDMPPEYRMDVMRGGSYVKTFQVKIFSPHWIYAWCEEKGLHCWERQHSPVERTSVDIWIR